MHTDSMTNADGSRQGAEHVHADSETDIQLPISRRLLTTRPVGLLKTP